MWGGKDHPPVTKKVEATWEKDQLILTCPTEGVSIAWQLTTEPVKGHWNLYTSPLEITRHDSIRALAVRIGYKQSPPSIFSMNNR